eukprot:CAMPEP_0184370524 /NCGR_PEP_ID=MMETSP1089-20130417/162875_1 /TAXON_ID=38269 ORGANISM="Gloeochaete wittrockiana, Strain SAG46.84" /NCGR_SAMPLE_ID=MMETSP1089 /ASSEMBLY_ACC=CAM_ASM_000445 /LENGTH=62 /DNA_ID=CAMNT_0026713149 /DNA_START=1006 /DNA_END=1194 /DNA_ORIENTATION=+
MIRSLHTCVCALRTRDIDRRQPGRLVNNDGLIPLRMYNEKEEEEEEEEEQTLAWYGDTGKND